MDQQLFLTPAVDYRPVPFWSWNGKLSKERLLQQIHSMHEAGMGGFFMHARSGLSTPYMQEDWFECVKCCVEEANLLGMKAWIYDENGWPSGYAGGAVPRLDRAFRAKALVMESIWRADNDEYRLITSRSSEDGQAVDYYYEWIQPLGQERFELASYVDLLHPQVIRAFIESTHDRYEQEVGQEFAGTIPGVFSDEACALLWLDPTKPALPWTEGLEAIFFESYGYELIPLIPYLFIDEASYKTVRYDYWRLITDLFAENYAKAIYQWCEAEGLLFTGHLMAEDHLAYQMEWVGDVMRQYEYMHIPGLDHLGRQIHKSSMELSETSYTTVLSAKQVSSIAHQLGKERCLSELFACAGQGFDPGLQKWMSDWHLVHGINLFSPHLLPYSFAGEGKRDYPPTIGPQQPWWQDYKLLADYQARMCYALTRGRRVTHILVLHPIESAFAEYSPLNSSSVNQKNAELHRLSLQLMDHHLDYDYGNEHYLEQYGEVTEQGFRVGECVYQTIIIPDCSRLRQSTLALFQNFVEKGGKIWATTALEELRKEQPDFNELPIELFKIADFVVEYPQGVVIEGNESKHIWMQERIDGEEKLIFLANLHLAPQSVQVIIKLEGNVKPQQLNAETGEMLDMSFKHHENKTIIEWVFLPKQSLLIQAVPSEEVLVSVVETKHRMELAAVASTLAFKPLDLNTVVLDTFSRRNQGVQQWEASAPLAYWRRNPQASASIEQYKAIFELEEQAVAIKLYAVVEAQLGSGVTCNGQALLKSSLHWLDADWLCYEIPRDVVIAGENSLVLELSGKQCGLMENMYVIGDFQTYFTSLGVPLISKPDYSKLIAGNLTSQGFPFYAGRMEVKTQLDLNAYDTSLNEGKLFLRLAQSSIATAALWVNEMECGVKAWDPWEWEMNSAELGGGSCEIRMIISNTLRNLIGPHHYQDDDKLNFIIPSHFWDLEHWSEARVLMPFGIDELYLEKETIG